LESEFVPFPGGGVDGFEESEPDGLTFAKNDAFSERLLEPTIIERIKKSPRPIPHFRFLLLFFIPSAVGVSS
jgi:hypothetical protein